MADQQLLDTEHSPGANHSSPPVSEDDRTQLPIIPVRDAVVFPGNVVPLLVDESTRVELLQTVLPRQREVLIVPLADNTRVADRQQSVVTRARVLRMHPQGEALIVLVEGLARARLVEIVGTAPTEQGISTAVVERTPPDTDDYWQAAVRNLREAAITLVRGTRSTPNEAESLIAGLNSASALTDFLAGNLELEFEKKLILLAEPDVLARLDVLQKAVSNQLRMMELQAKLRQDVETEFSDAQRRAYLREQLRAIQKELGEDNGSDEKLAELRQRLDNAQLPAEANTQIERELTRLERLPPASPDYAGTVDYLETVASLPWSTLSEDQLDLDRAEAILERDHHGLADVKRRLIEYLAVRKLNPSGRGPILCLVGPPGVGKTSLGQSVADALGRRFARIALGGVRDEAEIRGHRRTYVGAMLGRLLQELRRVGTRNPVLMLDEIDKLGADFRGDPASALLEVLDPAQNHSFVDHYLNIPFDLSQVVFITTANVLDTVPGPLRDRMEILSLSGYTPSEKRQIAQRYLIPRQIKQNGLTDRQLTWDVDGIDAVIDQYTREAGVRMLEQQIGAVIRSAAAKIARGANADAQVSVGEVADALGPPRFVAESKAAKSQPGVVNGLAYTPAGGEVLHIEALRYPGQGRLRLTGQLGSVMQESVQAAESLVKSRAQSLGVTGDLSTFDTHLHVPAGAVPKDGPSAGAAMFTALASLHSDRPVNRDVAMTGEINLRGQVLPIGGLAEKTLAALNAGIKTVLIPRGNEKDIPTLPEEVRASLELVVVDTVDDVLTRTLL